jgi:thiol-disulfide isomerase/thioredoxin
VGVGALLATGSGSAPQRVVTIPLADRNASPALLRAAEAVGFEPRTEAGSGVVESDRLADAPSGSSAGLLGVGTRAPQFSLRTPTGRRLSLGALRGHAVLLEFFATWCPHCAAEAPHLQHLYASFPRKDVSFAAIDADGETAPSVLAYHIYFGLGFPALLDPSSRPGSFTAPGSDGAVSTAYRIRTYPTFYVLDRSGRIVWAGQGEQPDSLLRHALNRAIAAR